MYHPMHPHLPVCLGLPIHVLYYPLSHTFSLVSSPFHFFHSPPPTFSISSTYLSQTIYLTHSISLSLLYFSFSHSLSFLLSFCTPFLHGVMHPSVMYSHVLYTIYIQCICVPSPPSLLLRPSPYCSSHSLILFCSSCVADHQDGSFLHKQRD